LALWHFGATPFGAVCAGPGPVASLPASSPFIARAGIDERSPAVRIAAANFQDIVASGYSRQKTWSLRSFFEKLTTKGWREPFTTRCRVSSAIRAGRFALAVKIADPVTEAVQAMPDSWLHRRPDRRRQPADEHWPIRFPDVLLGLIDRQRGRKMLKAIGDVFGLSCQARSML
jgi:hypothetical protein